MRTERVQAEQRRAQPLELEVGLDALEGGELAVAHAVLDVRREVEDLVDLVEVDGVVQNDLVLRVAREDRAPERDLRLEVGGTRERAGEAILDRRRVGGADRRGRTDRGEDHC